VNSIAQITDLHLDDFLADYYQIDSRKNLRTIFDDITKRNISNVVLTGDIGNRKSIPWLIEQLKEYDFSIDITLGNHDEQRYFKNTWLKQLNRESYYSRTIDGMNCIFLDSSKAKLEHKQIGWLKNAIKNQKELILFTHYPIFDCGNTAMDILYPLEKRESIQTILESFDSEIFIFCGHYHTEHEQRRGKIVQYLTPASIMQVKQQSNIVELDNLKFGYRVINKIKNQIQTEVIWFN
jgi:predicted phosphodiesterase